MYDSTSETESSTSTSESTAKPIGGPARRGRYRVRLSTVLLLMTIVAFAIAQYAASRRVSQFQAQNEVLRAQNATLRIEAGYLEVGNRSKVAVLEIPTLDELTWSWKIFLPKGKWELHYQVRGIPQNSGGTSSGTSHFDGDREVKVTASVRKNAQGEWQLVVIGENGSSRMNLGNDHRLIDPNQPRSFSHSNVGHGKVAVFDADKPVELIRLRTQDRVNTSKNSWTNQDPKGPTDGILIWLEPKSTSPPTTTTQPPVP